MRRWGLVFVLPRRFRSRDLALAGTWDGTDGHSNVVLSVLQEVLSHGVDPHFKLVLADQDLVRLVLFGSKVVYWVLPDIKVTRPSRQHQHWSELSYLFYF